ncbi:sensor histidine kinase [Paenibacillus sp. N3.4]|uniref:cache domain-containing sensor histidine kinase n=1 Tax=Paenibacillus sp. N3.4 TaxID=2603222 RepID=UPI0011C71AF0|nr:sensor histidine kinase [Paenibacillus sp. N3.4]TXK80635.1 HAMP domain-containing protein [Paenibacillus sp. N3.4]
MNKWIAKRSLFFRLFMYFIIVVFVSISLLAVTIYVQTAQKVNEQMQSNMSQVIDNALHYTESYIHDYDNSTLSLISDTNIMQFLDSVNLDDYEQYRYNALIKETVFTPIFIRHPQVVSAYLVSTDGRSIFGYNGTPGLPPTDTKAVEHLKQLMNETREDGGLTIFNASLAAANQGPAITLTRRARGYSSTHKGIIAIEVKSEGLSSLWQGINLSESGTFMIVDRQNQVVYHSDKSKMGKDYEGQPIVEGQPVVMNDDSGQKRLYMSRLSKLTGWNLVVSLPYEDLNRPIRNIRTNTILIGCLTLAIAMIVAYRFGRSITRPIKELQKGMRQTEKGEWTRISLSGKSNEVDSLITTYNSMVRKLSDQIEEIYEANLRKQEAQMERQKAEFQALQLQINPHFLYNTLETIICYAAFQESDEITEIVKSMAYMMRYSVQTSLEEITVVNELKHVLNYMVILKHRLGREFEIDVAVEPQYFLKKMVRLTLQPIIENIFQHAFPDGIEEHHFIRLDAIEDGPYFLFSVQDNGAGMSSERLQTLKEKLNENRLADVTGNQGGIGVLNVHRRIQMVFGEEYGLQIESLEGQGTIVRMYMPRDQ